MFLLPFVDLSKHLDSLTIPFLLQRKKLIIVLCSEYMVAIGAS